MSKLSQWALAVSSFAAFAFILFNTAFTLGSDTGACVAFAFAKDKEQSAYFCEHAKPVTHFPVKQIRDAWLWVVDDEWPKEPTNEQG